MPIVQLYYKDDKITGNELRSFIGDLTTVVASQMSINHTVSVEKGKASKLDINIKPRDVRVMTSRVSAFSGYDRNVGDLTINIFAHNYPERVHNSEKICKTIRSGVDHFLRTSEISASVLVHIVFAHIETA